MPTVEKASSDTISPVGASRSLTSRHAYGRLLLVAVQVALATLIIRLFHLEDRSLFYVMALVTVAFPLHALLPERYRLRAFVAVSVAAFVVVLGLVDAVALLAMASAMMAVCMAPVRVSLRVAGALGIGALWALARVDLLFVSLPSTIWPILGSLFMFRVALYLYQPARSGTARPSLWSTAAYFLMLPNVCFPLFPVVDHSTFLRSYYSVPAATIYERGATWIVRGIVHLLLYRLVYLHFTLDAAEVQNLGDLAQFLVTTFLLYLRVSGQFHLIIGIVHLFGFYLPETHKRYYLTSSFTDFWRRINIYWTDFMGKLVFYPSFFRLRRYGESTALAASTVAVFSVTWLLHSYQWFWLQRDFPITLPDILFWSILCGFVVFGTLRERRGRSPRLVAASKHWDVSRAWRTTVMFTTLCVLWSLWSAESVGEWIWMWRAAVNVEWFHLLVIAISAVSFFLIAGRNWDPPTLAAAAHIPFWRRSATRDIPLLLLIFAVGLPWVHAAIGGRPANILASLRSRDLNQRDEALRHKGYYEKLNGGAGAQLASAAWAVNPSQDAQLLQLIRPFERRRAAPTTEQLTQKREDFMLSELRPSVQVVHNGHIVTTNSAGLRGGEYQRHKPAGTTRIALLGPSYIMGSGVADDDTIAARLEARLNRSVADGGQRYEVLNFGVPGYSLLQQLFQLEDRVLAFNPDLVLITVGSRLDVSNFTMEHLTKVVSAGVAIPYPELQVIIEQSGIQETLAAGLPVPGPSLRQLAQAVGIKARMPLAEGESRLRERIDDVINWTLDRIARVSRERGATPGLLALNVVVPQSDRSLPVAAQTRGSYLIFNLLDVYDGRDLTSLRLSAADDHPNARACELIAERLYRDLMQQPEQFGAARQSEFRR